MVVRNESSNIRDNITGVSQCKIERSYIADDKNEKNIYLISYGDIDYDGRLRSLKRVMSQMGALFGIYRSSSVQEDSHIRICNSYYSQFIIEAVKYGKEIGNIDILVVDNRKATIPSLLLCKMLHVPVVIQDVRELYIPQEVHHASGKIGCYFERKMIKKTNIIICANKERASIMKKIYHLSEFPVVYENVRSLVYKDKESYVNAEKKLKRYIQPNEYRIVSLSGCSISRRNDVLVKNISKIKYKCRVFLVGKSNKNDEREIRKLLSRDKIQNVEIIEQLSQDELKYIIQNSHIGIVNYNQSDLNNKYCATGKLYEYIYEGIPVVTTTNPSLKKICSEEKIGISDDDYFRGINTIIENYSYFKLQVFDFAKKNTVMAYEDRLRKELEKRIASKFT